jgi:hypothetical protein
MVNCPENKIVNPVTGRCVKKDGAIGKALLEKAKTVPKNDVVKKQCSDDEVLNPKTGRCVQKTGKIGKALLLQSENKANVVPKQANEGPDLPKKGLQHKCVLRGMRQITGTCWFNSIFNCLVLGGLSGQYFVNIYNSLPIQERKEIEKNAVVTGTCPININLKYLLRYMLPILKSRTNIYSVTNRPEQLIDLMKVRKSPNWKKKYGYEINAAVSNVFNAVLNKDEYKIVRIPTLPQFKPSPNKTFYVVDTKLRLASTDILKFEEPWELDSAILYLQFKTKGVGHVICAYVCNEKEYIFDSNDMQKINLKWRNRPLKDIEKSIKKTILDEQYRRGPAGEIVSVQFSHLIYVNKMKVRK